MKLHDDVIVCDRSGRVLVADDSACRALAASGLLSEPDGAAARYLLPVRDAEADDVPLTLAAEGRLRFDLVPAARDGLAVWLVRLTDVTGARQLLQASRAIVLRMLGEGVVHKLRSPLNAIAMNAEMLRYSADDVGSAPAAQRRARYVAGICGEVARLSSAVDLFAGLLEFGPPGPQATDAAWLLDEVRRLGQPTLQGCQLDVRLEIEADLEPLMVDQALAVLALLALVLVVSESVDSGGSLVLAARADGAATRIDLRPLQVAATSPRLASDESATLLLAAAHIVDDARGVIDIAPAGDGISLSLPYEQAA